MSAMSEYLKKYTSSSGDEHKKKKKHKTSHGSSKMRILDDDAFVQVKANVRDLNSDDEEEIELIEKLKDQATKLGHFKKSFATADESAAPVFETKISFKIKEEPVSDSEKQKSASESSRRKRQDSDTSPPRPSGRKRHDSDASPPRSSGRRRHDSDASPPRPSGRKRHDSDASPPRPSGRKRHNSDASPPRPSGRKRHDSDASPPRPSGRKRHDSDASPPRPSGRKRHDSDASPPRQRTKRNHSSDESPPRSRKRRDSDASPRSSAKHHSRSQSSIKEEPVSDEEGPSNKTLDGKRAGLQSAKALKDEMEERKRRQQETFDQMDPSVSGRDAAAVKRAKMYGKRPNAEEEEKKKREAAKQAELEQKYKSWNKGVVQIQKKEEAVQEAARVMNEPLARSKDDADMNEHLMNMLYDDDPMVDYMMKQRTKDDVSKGKTIYPRYNHPFPPNRYGIRPGYRWDGVDRGNGFEARLVGMANKRAADEAETYKLMQTLE